MTPTASVRTRRRGQLSRARILATALQLVDLDGLDALSMRRLADELKVDPMSLYNHVGSKDALLDGLAEALWNEVQLPAGEIGWQEALRTLATLLRDLAHTHPTPIPSCSAGAFCRSRRCARWTPRWLPWG